MTFKRADLVTLSRSPWVRRLHSLLGPPARPVAWCQSSAEALGASLCEPEARARFGLESAKPLSLARLEHHWIWSFGSGAWRERAGALIWPQDAPITSAEFIAQGVWRLELGEARGEAAGEAWMIFGQGEQRALLIADSVERDPALGRALAQRLAAMTPSARWRASPQRRELHDQLTARGELALVFGTAQLSELMAASNPSAERARQALLFEVDLIGIGLRRSQASALRLEGELLMRSGQRAALPLSELKPSRAALDEPLGALLGDASLGALHLAISPESVLRIWRGALSSEQLAAFDAFTAHLDEELLLELEEAVLPSFLGHLIVVFHELEPPRHEGGEAGRGAGRSGLLEATRETLYLPYTDRAPTERLLDALTQLGRGALRRQREGDVLQYVWVDREELRGAVLLGERGMMIVDSATSTEHAMAHLTAPRALSDAERARYAPLFAGRRGGVGFSLRPKALGPGLAPPLDAVFDAMSQLDVIAFEQSASSPHQARATFSIEIDDEPTSSPRGAQ